jgi:uncharacterized protein (DUF1778 family)
MTSQGNGQFSHRETCENNYPPHFPHPAKSRSSCQSPTLASHPNAIGKPMPIWHLMDMAHVTKEPRKRITVRVSDSVRDTLEQAAELLGATVNQFVVQTAYLEAQRVIERHSVIRLSQKDARKVFTLLDSPAQTQQAR